jgi:predicted DNA-binding protein
MSQDSLKAYQRRASTNQPSAPASGGHTGDQEPATGEPPRQEPNVEPEPLGASNPEPVLRALQRPVRGRGLGSLEAVVEPQKQPELVDLAPRPVRSSGKGARLPDQLYHRLKAYADQHGLFFDQVLAEAVDHHGEEVLQRLLGTRGAERRRKGLRADVTPFHLRADDAEKFDDLERRWAEKVPSVNRSRLITELIDTFLTAQVAVDTDTER